MKTNSQKKRINIALLEVDLCQADIAREIKTTRQYVSNVINGLKRSARVEDLIAEKTGIPVESLFIYRSEAHEKNLAENRPSSEVNKIDSN